MGLAVGVAVGAEIAGPTLLAGGARLATAYQAAGISIAVNYPRLTAAVIALSAGMAGVSTSSSGGTVAAEEQAAASSLPRGVWSLNPFVRGRIIEALFGRNATGPTLASNFPVIDRVVVQGTEDVASKVVSVKSIDLSSASYQSGNAVLNRLTQYINSLAGFTEQTWGGVTVQTGANTVRTLELAIPPTVMTQSQQNQVTQAAQYALQHGVQLITRVVQ
jgi:hypothetical protein